MFMFAFQGYLEHAFPMVRLSSCRFKHTMHEPVTLPRSCPAGCSVHSCQPSHCTSNASLVHEAMFSLCSSALPTHDVRASREQSG